MQRPFLRAHWSHLCVLSYAVPPHLLEPHLPRGCTLDTLSGQAFLSVVTFDFENTRVHGIGWPFHRDFPEVNLRFYARDRAGHRGVVFIKEFVSKRLVCWVAHHNFCEHFECVPVTSDVHRSNDGLLAVRKFRHHGRWQEVSVSATREAPLLPPEDSPDAFFLDQQWGFGKDGSGQAHRFRVAHPRWLCHHVNWAEVKINWAKTYGPQWKFLDHRKPDSRILAEGSEVVVFPPEPNVAR